MAAPIRILGLHGALLLLAALATAGCATPALVGRCHVDTELAARTGQGLGPEQPACEVAWPECVNWEDGLSEEEAVVVGLWNNPNYQTLLADLQITQADFIQARQIPNPEISTMFPLGVKQWEFALTVPLDVLLLRPCRTAAAQLESHRVAQRLVQDGLNVIRDVRTSYIDLVQAEQQLRVAQQGVVLQDRFAEIAEGRLAAGAVAELDVSALRLQALFVEEQAVQAARDADLAREQLRFQLGFALAGIDVSTTPLDDVATLLADGPAPADAESLVAEAITSRPDLRALDMAVAAARERARIARYDYLNFAAILPDINGQGRKGFEAGPGIGMFLPLFNQNQGAKARAAAEVARLTRQFDQQRDTVAMEVR